jgi:hypothetical protein
MRPRVVAASTATLIAAASLSPLAAQAAVQNTIYVNSGSSLCTDSGSGTSAAPYCSIQAAADVASPGDVVVISGGNYASGATITRSGTASNPIIFTGATPGASIGGSTTASSELRLSSASGIEIENLTISTGTSAAVTVNGGSGDTIANDTFPASAAGKIAVHVTGGASAVIVRDSLVRAGIVVDGAASGTVVTTNEFVRSLNTPIAVQGAANTAVTSNTVIACGPGIAVGNSSSATSIENNVVTVSPSTLCPAAAVPFGVQVDASSASGTRLDYNDVFTPETTGAAYSWDGTSYATAAALYAAAGEGRHDYNGADGASTFEGSPIINSADSGAIGEQPVDINGNPRALDPLVKPTGAGPYNYYDRGATQFQDPYTATISSSLTVSATKVPTGTTVTVNASVADTWGDAINSYEFEFGTLTVTTSTPTASFTPTSAGSYPVGILASGPGISGYHALTGLGNTAVQVVAPQPLTPAMTFSPNGSLGVNVSDTGTTDEWNISTVTFDFGDHTPTQTVADGVPASHVYAKAGTYTITESVKDAAENTATTTKAFTTIDPPAGTLVHFDGGGTAGDVPANSTGIVQAAYGVTPGNNQQLVAATTNGSVEFSSTAPSSWTWANWQTLSQPGVTAKRVGIAPMPNGTTQVVEVTSTGALLHTVRNANGTWQAQGWGSPAGSVGFTRAAIAAMPNGDAQLVAVTSTGVLMHNIRFANGAWQGWRALAQPGVKIIDASIACMPDGSAQIAEVTSTDVLKHNIRLANGTWQAQGWGSPAGSTGIAQAAITSQADQTHALAVEPNGTLEDNIRISSGHWLGWGQLSMGTLVSATYVTVGSDVLGNLGIFVVSGG